MVANTLNTILNRLVSIVSADIIVNPDLRGSIPEQQHRYVPVLQVRREEIAL